MAITIKHAKTDTIADWTQADLDAQIALGNYPVGTVLADIVLPSDWNHTHDFTGIAASGANSDITSLSGITGGISTPTYVQLDTTATVSVGLGKLRWNTTTATASFGIVDGTDEVNIGEQVFAYVTNAESVAITRGQPVYLFGAVGNRASVKLASNLSDATSAKTLGLVAQDSIAAGATGFVIGQGQLSKLDTSAYTAGDTLYLGATAGTLTNVKPKAPNHLVYIGVVERSNAGNGQIYVRAQNGYELDEIHDVQINSPVNGQTIIYDASTALWKNANLTAGTGISITNGASSITVTNSSPDQTVVLTPVAPITVTGTYPNFTLGITQSGTASNGYLSSTDWNTFNGKYSVGGALGTPSSGTLTNCTGLPVGGISATGTPSSTTYLRGDGTWATVTGGSGTVTSVSGTGTVNGITLTGTVTSSGSLTLGGTLSGVDLTSQVTGTLPFANGGTSKTTAPAASAALMGFTTTATAGGTTTLTNTSSVYQVFTGTAAQTVQLPATSTLAQGWSFHIVNNSTNILTINTSTSVTLGTISPGATMMTTALTTTGNTAADWEVGFTDLSVDARMVPQNAQTGNYTLATTDISKHIYHASGAGAAVYTIPANSAVPFEIGTTLTFINMSTTAPTIAITTDTMYLAGTGTTGTRTLAQYGIATAIKMTATTWMISGSGLT